MFSLTARAFLHVLSSALESGRRRLISSARTSCESDLKNSACGGPSRGFFNMSVPVMSEGIRSAWN